MSKKKKQNTQEVKKEGVQIDKEINDLGEILSGEMLLKERKEEIMKAKKKALEKQKRAMQKNLKNGKVKIKDFKKNSKVVQKIKLFEWEAPIRVPFEFEKRNFLIIVVFCLIFILYLAILGHYGLMFAIIALLFLIYVAGTTEAVDVKHSITARGVETMDVLYEWYMLDSFFFTKKKGRYLLILDTNLRFPSRLILLLNKEDLPSIFLLLQDQLLYQDIKKQHWTEKLSLGEYIPLEKI